MITAHDLTINAVDNIGAKGRPIRLTVSGKLRLSSLRGYIWYKNFFRKAGRAAKQDGWTLLVDPETQISVYGRFAPGAYLEVTNTNHYAQMMYPELLKDIVTCECENLHDYYEDCTANGSPEALKALIDNTEIEACKLLWTLIGDGKTLYDFVLGIFAPTQPVCTSEMYFKIDFNELDSTYDDALEGQTVYVMLCVEGKLVCVQAFVEDGCIYLVLDKLGMEKADFGYTQFTIVNEETFFELIDAGQIPEGSLIDSNGRPIVLDLEAEDEADA